MASQLAAKFAQPVVQHSRAFDGKPRKFFYEVCRCLPFIHKSLHLDEIITLQDLRTAVNEQFKKYSNVKNEKVVDMLIFKGREELEITEYLEPLLEKKTAARLPRKLTNVSPFLADFLDKAK